MRVEPGQDDAPRGERRRSDRRAAAPRDSLFDAIGMPPDVAGDGGASSRTERSGFVPGWGDSGSGAESRFLSRQARRVVSAGNVSTFERLFRIFVGARAVLGLALLLAQVLGNLFGAYSPFALTVCFLYAVLALTLWALPRIRKASPARTRLTRRQWLGTIGVDLLTFSVLHALAAGGAFNYVALLLLPVLMSGVLTARQPTAEEKARLHGGKCFRKPGRAERNLFISLDYFCPGQGIG